MRIRSKIIIGVMTLLLVVAALTAVGFASTAEPQPAELSIKTFSLSLENAVYMNFKVKSVNVSDPSDIELLVWTEAPEAYAKGTEDLCITESVTEENTQYEAFQYDDLAAKDMTKMVYACAYVNENGTEAYSAPVKLSVAMYADMKRNATTPDEDLVKLLDSMLAYGAQAQLYFDHNTDFLATDPISKISVVGGQLDDGFALGWYKVGSTVTITADAAEDGYVFSHWENGAGEEVSTDATFELEVTESDEVYTAVYEEEITYSKGLAFTEINGGTEYEVSVGNCTDTEIIIPAAYKGKPVTSIADNAFKNCSDITSVYIPDSITIIGDFAFQNCTKLSNVAMTEGIITLEWGVFYGCQSIVNINIPASVESIGRSSFEDCTSLVSIEIPDGVTSIEHYMFSGCRNLTDVKIPNSVTSIGNYAFRYCGKLSSIDLPNNLTSMGQQVFNGCTALTTVKIPDSYTHIGQSTFYGFAGESVEIPKSVVEIAYGAFENCTNLKTVYYMGTEAEWNEITISGNNTPLRSATVHFIKASSDGLAFTEINGSTEYEVSVGDCTDTEIIIPATYNGKPVTKIANSAFENYSNLTNITLPDSITALGEYAFAECSKLTNIAIPNNVTSIGVGAFFECSGLTNISIPDGITSISNATFYGCSGLTSVTIPNGLTSIGMNAFDGCINLTNIIIPDSVTSIGDYAFNYCQSIASITIPKGVTSIGMSAFAGCSSLISISIPDSVTSIGYSAFYNCSSLTSIVISNSITRIGQEAFSSCSLLTSINFNGTKAQWNAITKGTDWNYNTGNYTIYCTDGNISK